MPPHPRLGRCTCEHFDDRISHSITFLPLQTIDGPPFIIHQRNVTLLSEWHVALR